MGKELGVKKREMAEALTAEMEAVGREYAATTGFDMQTEPDALFRMLMTVMSTPALFADAKARVLKKHPEWSGKES